MTSQVFIAESFDARSKTTVLTLGPDHMGGLMFPTRTCNPGSLTHHSCWG